MEAILATIFNDAQIATGESVLRKLATDVGVSPAMDRMIEFRNENRPGSNPRYWAAVNFNLHSSVPRLFLFDRQDEKVTSYLCAHGKGSEGPKDDGYAEIFSNVDGSHCTCLGIFRTGQTYHGYHGHSLYLHGLEATNFNALSRHIVMHAAKYVTPEFAKKHRRIGRSLGCPAVEPKHSKYIIDALRGGSLLIHWKSGK